MEYKDLYPIGIGIEEFRRIKGYMSATGDRHGIWKTMDGKVLDKAKGDDLGHILDGHGGYKGLGRSRVMRSRVGTYYWYMSMGGVFHDEKVIDF